MVEERTSSEVAPGSETIIGPYPSPIEAPQFINA